jgi:hypothetical protein
MRNNLLTGDIVNVGIEADLDLANDIDLTAVDFGVIYKNMEKILLGQVEDDSRFPNFPISQDTFDSFLSAMQN